MWWLVLVIYMTRGANVRVQVPFDTLEACQKAESQYLANGLSSVVISTSHTCKQS